MTASFATACKRPLRGIAAALALVGLASCKDPPPPPPADVVRPVKMVEVGETGRTTRQWPGKVAPAQNADISFEVAGKLVALEVEEGQQVKKGELLARLDGGDFKARLDGERAKLKQTKAEYERSKSLFEQDVVARAELDRKERLFRVQESAVKEAQRAMSNTTVRAPFSGTIAQVVADNFQQVQAKQTILTLQDKSSLEVVTYVPERDAALARPGLTVEERTARSQPKVTIDPLPELVLDGTLKEFATVADAVTQTYAVTWRIDPPEGVNLLPGMTAKVTISLPDDIQEAAGFLLPAHAVGGGDDGEPFVWIVDARSMAVSRASVKVGPMKGSSIEIVDGLSEGQLIAISGIQQLRDGMVVSRLES